MVWSCMLCSLFCADDVENGLSDIVLDVCADSTGIDFFFDLYSKTVDRVGASKQKRPRIMSKKRIRLLI